MLYCALSNVEVVICLKTCSGRADVSKGGLELILAEGQRIGWGIEDVFEVARS